MGVESGRLVAQTMTVLYEDKEDEDDEEDGEEEGENEDNKLGIMSTHWHT